MSFDEPGMKEPGMDNCTMGGAETEEKSNLWIYIAAGAGAAVVIAIVIVVIVLKRKKKKKMLKELEDSSTDEIL